MHDVLIIIGALILIALIVSFVISSIRRARNKLLPLGEDAKAHVENVRLSIGKYRREVASARELLAIGIMIIEQGRIDLKIEEVKSIALPLQMGEYQSQNFYSLLETVLKIIAKSKEDLLLNIEQANMELASYNAYLTTPVFPELLANELGTSTYDWDRGTLQDIEEQLAQGVFAADFLDGSIERMLNVAGGEPRSDV
jgi:hypothetical protein